MSLQPSYRKPYLALATLTLAAITAGAQTTPPPTDSLQQTLESTRRSAMSAWQHKDSAALTAIMAPDFHFVSPQGVAPREGWLGSLAHCSLSSYTMDHVTFTPVSPDAAILIYDLHYAGDCDGTPVPPESRVTDTFSRRDGKWWILNTDYMPRL